MGMCLSKHAHVDEIPQPMAGVDRIQVAKTSLPGKTKSSSQENQRKNKAFDYPLQERNTPSPSLNSQKGRRSKGGKDGSSANPRDWSVSKLNKKDEICPAYKLNCFCYNVLKSATQKFSEKNLIGQGGFGDVYKGYINLCTMNAAKPNDGGSAIAVKRLRSNRPQGHDEWLNEMKFLSRMNHPNIVKLLGYCCQGEHRILVYEYMTKGSLEAHLLRDNDTDLDWRRRVKIAIEAARGLEYLHTRGKPVIHRDLKASNVLLGTDFNAKLSDFGLAKFGPQGEQTHVSTRILGTRGYFAPEYIATGRLTLKTDVFSFGVVLLEILSGCGAIKKHSDGLPRNLAQWAKPHLCNKLELHHVIDKKLRSIPKEEAQDFAKIILRCLSSIPKTRPTMSEVVVDLEKLHQSIDTRR